MTDVALSDDLSIRYSDRQWMLVRKVMRKARDTGLAYEGEDVLGYYGDLGALARRLLEDELGTLGSITGAKELAKAVSDAREGVTAAIFKASGWPERRATPVPTPSAAPSLPTGPTGRVKRTYTRRKK